MSVKGKDKDEGGGMKDEISIRRCPTLPYGDLGPSVLEG